MNLRLSLDTDDRALGFELMGSPKTMGAGSKADVPGIGTLTLTQMRVRKGFGAPETLDLVLSFGTGVASGVIANWIYQKLKGHHVTLRVEELEVEVDEGQITRVVSKIIEKSE